MRKTIILSTCVWGGLLGGLGQAQTTSSLTLLLPCSPYNWAASCAPPALEVDFAEVLLGPPESAFPFVAFVNLTNKEATENEFTISVTSEVFATPVERTFVLRPYQRLPINLNEWPAFIGRGPLGVSVTVTARGRGMAAVALHSTVALPIILSGR